jgi:hypothetical protein
MTVRTDNRLTERPMVSVCCWRCAAHVLARKSSWNQTSVQWNADASAACLERDNPQNSVAYSGRGVFLACSALTGSIIEAVRHGNLSVLDETD